ncbi:MAG: hypothetical protein ABUS57_10415, partial [Pseudomonadota bacterium]
MRVLLILALIFAAAPCATHAEVREGVLVADTLISTDGTQAWPLMWSDCSGAAEPMRRFRCESGGLKYYNFPPECIVADVEPARAPPSMSYYESTLLVRHIIRRSPYFKA